MDRINTHSTNRDGLLLLRSESRSASGTTSSASQFVLQWGGQKRLRHSTSNDPTGWRTGRRATARIDHRLVKSDTNDNSGEDPLTNRQTLVNFVRSAGGHLNLRQRPASPSSRILRSSEGSIGMKGLGNGVMDRKVPPINTNNHNKNTSNNIITNCSKNNNVNNSHHNKDNHRVAGGVGSGSPEAVTAIWPPKFVIALTNKEKEEDFMAIKGSKLPQRPKKRAKFIQRTLNLVSPGAWLCDLTLERYEVREKKVSKKRPRGLKAMGNMDSDSE